MSAKNLIVLDAVTGEHLAGAVSPTLAGKTTANATLVNGSWMYAAPVAYAALISHGKQIQLVRVVSYEATVGALVKLFCDLADHADNELTNRAERAYESSLSDYYGGSSPQTNVERLARDAELDADDRAALRELRASLTVVS